MRKIPQHCPAGHTRIDFHYKGLVVRHFPEHGVIKKEIAALFAFHAPDARGIKEPKPQEFPYYLADLRRIAATKKNPDALQNAFITARDDLEYVLKHFPRVSESWQGLPFYPKRPIAITRDV